MNCKVSQQRSSLVSGCFTAKVSQNELQSFAAKVRSCQWMLHRKSFTKWIAKFRSKGSVLSVHASPQKFHKMNCKISQQRSGLVSGYFAAKVSQNELQSFAAKVRSCQWRLHRKSFTKWIAKFRSKGPVLSVDASPQKFHKMNCKVSQQRSVLVSGGFTAKVSQNELQSFTAKVRSCQWMLRRKSFTKWIAKCHSKGPVLSVDASPQKFHKMNCKVSQQRSGLVSGCFITKGSQNELQSFAAKVRSCQGTLHRKSFTKWIAKFRSKGPVLSVDASPQKFHKMNCKVSQQRPGLVSGCFTAKVSQNELQSFAAKVRSCQWRLHRKSFTKWIAKFHSKGPVLSVDASPQKFHKMNCKMSQQRSGLVSGCFTAKVSQNELQSFAAKVRSCQWMLHRKSFTKWIAKFRSKGPVLSVDASPQKFHKMNCKVLQQRSGLVSGCFTAKVSQNELQSFAAKVRSCQGTLHRKRFTKWIAKFRSKGLVLSVDASPQKFHKMNRKVSQQRSGLVSGYFAAKVSQNELQSFGAKVRSCQWMLHLKSFTKWIAKSRSKGPVLSVDASPQKFHKMNCKVSQQRPGLVSGCFTAKVSQNELQSFAAKVRSCQWMLHRKSFTKWIAKFRSKGPILSGDTSPQKFHKMNCKVSQQRPGLVSGCFTAKVSQNESQSFAAKVRSCQWILRRKSFTKWIAKFRSKGPVLSVDASPQKFHKMNCKVSQQRSGLVSGCFTAKVSQNELQSFAAKARSCQWMLHRKSFTKWIAKFRSKGPVLSVDASPQKFRKMNCKVSQQRSSLVSGCFTVKVSQNELQSFAAKVRSCQWILRRKSFTKWIAKFRSKDPVLSVDASAAQQRSSNVSVDRDVCLVLEILGQKLFSAGVTAQAAFQKLSLGVRYIGVPLHVCQFAWQARRTRRTRRTREKIFCTVEFARAN